jgi:AraC family transcriptional regulator, transcriptional activator of the genes for pyochelin and ferripyochelin receptors
MDFASVNETWCIKSNNLMEIISEFNFGGPGERTKGKMQLCEYSLEEKTKFPFMPKRPFLGLIFNLKNRIDYTIDDTPGVIHKGHYNMVYLPEGGCDLNLEKGCYAIFIAEFNPGFLKMISKSLPVLEDFLSKTGGPAPAIMCGVHPIMMPSMLFSIYEVVHTDFTDEARSLYLDAKSIDLLITCIEHCQHFIAGVDEVEIEKIRSAGDYIKENIRFRLDVDFLADKVRLNRRKLALGFKAVYGTSVLDFITQERMKRALALLRDTTMSLSEISAALGYTRLNNFYKIFKRRFGQSPGELRKSDDE